MKTIYIDVYFMINFTVDILALFIASKISNLRIGIYRLIICGLFGGVLAIAELLINSTVARVFLSILFICFITLVLCRKSSLLRKTKLLISFYISSFLIGGTVQYIYDLLDKHMDLIEIDLSGEINRRILIFSVIIIIIIGVLRLIIMTLSESINEKNVRIKISLENKELELEALIDTGNLVKDPMNMNPVIFLKSEYALKIIPKEVIELTDIDRLSSNFRKRIRLVPVTRNSETHVMTGIRVDSVKMYTKDKGEEIDATILIDKEEGTYGGYYALAPYVSI